MLKVNILFLGTRKHGFSAKEENCSYHAHVRNIEKEAQTGDMDNPHNWSSFYRGDHRELRRQCSYWQAWEARLFFFNINLFILIGG